MDRGVIPDINRTQLMLAKFTPSCNDDSRTFYDRKVDIILQFIKMKHNATQTLVIV